MQLALSLFIGYPEIPEREVFNASKKKTFSQFFLFSVTFKRLNFVQSKNFTKSHTVSHLNIIFSPHAVFGTKKKQSSFNRDTLQ